MGYIETTFSPLPITVHPTIDPSLGISFNDLIYLSASSTYNLQLTIVTKGKTINKMNDWVFSSSAAGTAIPSSRCSLSIHGDAVEGLFNPLKKCKLMDFYTDFDVMYPVKIKSNDAIRINLNTNRVPLQFASFNINWLSDYR